MGVNFEEKLRNQQYDDLWQEYCGFLDLDIGGYMQIQRRLMEEQIGLWSASALGKKLLDGGRPRDGRGVPPRGSADDLRGLRRTSLLQKRSEMLPAEPVVWIQTTWEGGKHPIKLAPYTRGMLDVFKRNMVAALMLATSKRPGQFSIAPLRPDPLRAGAAALCDGTVPADARRGAAPAVFAAGGRGGEDVVRRAQQKGLRARPAKRTRPLFRAEQRHQLYHHELHRGGREIEKEPVPVFPRHGLPLPRGLLPREAGRPHRAAEGHLPPQGAHLRGHRHKLLQTPRSRRRGGCVRWRFTRAPSRR